MAEYETLENIKSNEGELKNKRVVTAFKDHYDEGQLSKELVKIVQDLDLGIDVQESNNSFTPSQDLVKFFERLGFKSAIKKLQEVEFGSFQAMQNEEEGKFWNYKYRPAIPEFDMVKISDSASFVTLEKKIMDEKFVACYTTYSSSDVTDRKMVSAYFSFGEKECYSVDVYQVGEEFFLLGCLDLQVVKNQNLYGARKKRRAKFSKLWR